MAKNKENKIKTVGDLREFLTKFPDNLPILAEYKYYSGCDTCGWWDKEGELKIAELGTRLVFRGEEEE